MNPQFGEFRTSDIFVILHLLKQLLTVSDLLDW